MLCGDESRRFLAFAAADPWEEAINVRSALLLLEDVEFYRDRSRSFRALLGRGVVGGRRDLGELRDLRLAPDGTVTALVVEQADLIQEIGPAGTTIESEHVSPA